MNEGLGELKCRRHFVLIVPGIVDVLPAVSHAAVKTTFTLGLSPNDHFSASLMYSALSTVYSLLVVLAVTVPGASPALGASS